MICGRCRSCPEFQGDITLSMTSYDCHLSFFIVGRRSGIRCPFKADILIESWNATKEIVK